MCVCVCVWGGGGWRDYEEQTNKTHSISVDHYANVLKIYIFLSQNLPMALQTSAKASANSEGHFSGVEVARVGSQINGLQGTSCN